MLTEDRQGRIQKEIEKNHSVSVSELSAALQTSESTVRRDLLAMEEKGLLKRVHGGAVSLQAERALREPDVREKQALFAPEKEAIARYAASTIQKDDLVYLDAGTTTEKMIEVLTEREATYVTNAFFHAARLAERGFSVILTGGEVKPSTQALVGAACLESIRNYRFTKAFLGANGISLDGGFTTPNLNEAAVKRAAAQQSFVTYILADHSKFNRLSAVTFAPLPSACIVTDRLPDERFRGQTVLKEVMK